MRTMSSKCLTGFVIIFTLSCRLIGGIRTSSTEYRSIISRSAREGTSMTEFSNRPQIENRQDLYRAFSTLHSLSQAYNKPFDSPAVLVVGHQTSGKSALIEALMGFQFNEVGGGTKTRRPISLQMQYNPNCTVPKCFLTTDGDGERAKSLSEIQEYIRLENARLEAAQAFDTRDIQIRVEYRYCPNMIIIDTPGLIHPPRGTSLTAQQQALADAAEATEALVVEKMRCRDYVILCVEDTSDWKHATTRNIVMQEDPLLSRTVLVTTKLDTKLPQFADSGDLTDFLRADIVRRLFPQLSGGPFFTSVPAGRVGSQKEFLDNDEFTRSLRSLEAADRTKIESRAGPRESPPLTNIGVSQLRQFLEQRIEDTYRSSVSKTLPLLRKEYAAAQSSLKTVEEELSLLDSESPKDCMHEYREEFSRRLTDALHGTNRVSVQKWGETLASERSRGGSFGEEDAEVRPDGGEWSSALAEEVGSAENKLFGGAQYHRALRDFSAAVRHMKPVLVTDDEIANAAGVGDTHDGVNIMRTACVLALDKAHETFEPLLAALQCRCEYIMKRLVPVVNDMVVTSDDSIRMRKGRARSVSHQHSEIVKRIFERFVDDQIADCLEKCRDDLRGMTRYVTWDIGSNGGGVDFKSILKQMLPGRQDIPELLLKEEPLDPEPEYDDPRGALSIVPWTRRVGKVVRGLIPVVSRHLEQSTGINRNLLSMTIATTDPSLLLKTSAADMDSTNNQILQLTQDLLGSRSATRSESVVKTLIQLIVQSWQEQFTKNVVTKLNCFFLLPFIDKFPSHLRSEVDRIYAEEANSIIEQQSDDKQRAREKLEKVRASLVAESDSNMKLQEQFEKLLRYGLSKKPILQDNIAEITESANQEFVDISNPSTFHSDMNNGRSEHQREASPGSASSRVQAKRVSFRSPAALRRTKNRGTSDSLI